MYMTMLGAVYDYEERPGGAAWRWNLTIHNSTQLQPKRISDVLARIKRGVTHFQLVLSISSTTSAYVHAGVVPIHLVHIP